MSLNYEEEVAPGTRVLVISPLNTYWSFQLTAEAALRSREKTDMVKWLNVSTHQKKNFEVNSQDHLARWRYKNPAKRMGLVLKQHGIAVNSNYIEFSDNYASPKFDSLAEMRRFKLDDLNFGAIVFSAIASVRKSTALVIGDISDEINHFFLCGFEVRDKIEHEILAYKPDLIITINDRLLGSSVALSLAKKHHIKSYVIYWGSNSNSVQDYVHSLYDPYAWREDIARNWLENPPSVNEFSDLRFELDQFAKNPTEDSQTYLDGHVVGKSIAKSGSTCIFYAQSEHEHSPNFIAQSTRRFQTQYEAFDALQKTAKKYGWNLILKYHPIKKEHKKSTMSTANTIDWKSISIDESVTEILPDSDLDTYQLIQDADLNVVWGSTVGLESIARSCPTLILGNISWLNLDWKIHAWTLDQLDEFFASELKTIDRDLLIPYFWYLKSFGDPVRYAVLDQGKVLVAGYQILVERKLVRVLVPFLRRIKVLLVRLNFLDA